MNPAFATEFTMDEQAVEERKVSPEGRLCSQVILEALQDLRYAQVGKGQYGGQPYETAVKFFFAEPSPLDWMCAGLEIDVDRVRDRARELFAEREEFRDVPTTIRDARKGGAGIRGRRLEAGR